MKALAPPTYTQIPNEILDAVHLMKESELRVLMVICRETFGWHRESEILSISRLQALTGLSKMGVMFGIADAIDRGFLERVAAGKQSFSYRLLVNLVDRSTKLTGQDTLPEQVNYLDRQMAKPVKLVDPPPLKKDLKKLKEKAAAAAAVFGAIISPTDALRLVETHPECVDHAEALVREASKPKINDPAGMLVHLVTTGWVPPAVTSNGHGPADKEDMTGYLGGYCATCAAITFGSCGHDEQPAASSRPRRRGRQPA